MPRKRRGTFLRVSRDWRRPTAERARTSICNARERRTLVAGALDGATLVALRGRARRRKRS
ncbi:MAG TPA: hypothetical protein VG474_02430 [Solirubrobacteraceae bacterium]|nr:hypothetical protein [Solirubrobacteraceae bacterium]